MEKLSSILAASPRVKSVDMSDAKPTRPGAPNYGGPVGTTSVGDRVTLSNRARDLAIKDSIGGRNPREAVKARIAENVTRDFFETRLKPVAKEVDTSMSEDIADDLTETPVTMPVETAKPAVDSAYEFSTVGTNLDTEA